MDKQKLIHQLFIGKVTDVIGVRKTIKLLKEATDEIMLSNLKTDGKTT